MTKTFDTIDDIRDYARTLEREAIKRGLHAQASIEIPLRKGSAIKIVISDVDNIMARSVIKTQHVRLTGDKGTKE